MSPLRHKRIFYGYLTDPPRYFGDQPTKGSINSTIFSLFGWFWEPPG